MSNRTSIIRFVCILILTCGLCACAGTGTSESTGQYIDNAVITAKVKAELLKEESLKSFQVKIKTYKNVVQLSGFVNTQQQKDKAAQVASRVGGVREVRNDIIIK